MNAANVTTGKRRTAGGIYRAAAGTTLPTDATTSLAAAFKEIGYISEDGVTNSISKTTNEIKEWGGDTVDSEVSEQTDQFTFKSIESMNVDTLKAVFGDTNVTESTGAITILVKAGAFGEGVWVIDVAQKGGRLKRIVIPDGKITALGDIVYNGSEAVGYDITLSAFYDSTICGTHKEYISAATST